jgi:hypothetical protein
MTTPVPPNGNQWMGWGLRLLTYTKNRDIFRSPLLDRRGAFAGGCASSNGMELTNSYSLNYLLSGDGTYPGYGPTTPLSYTSVEESANTVQFLLSNSLPPYGRTWGCIYTTLEASDFINKIRFRAIHRDGGNLTFTDSHAKFFTADVADAANNGPSGKPGSGTGPRCTIYTWRNRNMWTIPTFPGSRTVAGLTFNNSTGTGCPVE